MFIDLCVRVFVCVCIGTPKHLDYEEVKNDLNAVEGVKQAHSLHIWSITLNRTALAAHLALGQSSSSSLCVHVLERLQWEALPCHLS